MSNYRHIVFDLARRCEKLLNACWREAGCQDAEVTLMLSLAEASIMIPYERLKKPCPPPPMACPHCRAKLGTCPACHKELQELPQPHPSGNREALPHASNSLDKLTEEAFIASSLGPKNPGSWCFGTVDNLDCLEDVVENQRTGNKIGNKMAWTVVKHIRNALAHGNIFTVAQTTESGRVEIGKLVFLSLPIRSSTWDYLSVTPTDFREFFQKWLGFIRDIQIPECVVEDGDFEDISEASVLT